MRIETNEDLAVAKLLLARRTQDSLAAFVLSLAFDTGPVGEQVRTFIVGDDIEQASSSLKGRIAQLRDLALRENSHRFGEVVAQRLEFILNAIENQVLPTDQKMAFDLLVMLIERDGDALENCGDYSDRVVDAIERAVGLIANAAQALPKAEIKLALEPLVARDDYGTRRSLLAVVNAHS